MTTLPRPVAFPRSFAGRRFGLLLQLALWALAAGVLAPYLAEGPPASGGRLLVGNTALLAAMVFGVVCCVTSACRRSPARRAWVLISVALGLGALGQVVFTAAILRGAPPQASPVTDTLSYLGYSLPLLVALFLFPRPPERLISRFRGVVDAVVITTGILLVSEGTVLGVLWDAVDLSSPAGLATLAYPVADVAICSVVLTLGMRQAPADRLVWLCMGTGLLSLAVTDSVYVRLLARGVEDATGTPLLLGWIAVPVLIGLASQATGRAATGRHWNFDLALQFVPYAPVVGAAAVLVVRPDGMDPFLLASGVALLVIVTVRQVMIVYENLGLTRDLERKVAERTVELETLGSIVTSSRDAIVSWDPDRTVAAWNPAAEQLFGYRAADVLGGGAGFLPPATQQRIEDLLGAAGRGEPLGSYEIDWTRPDGSTIPVAMTVSPVRSDCGRVSGISISAQDISARRREAEALEQAREEALQSSRAKSEFLATMSHEIRTPMNGVIGLVSLLVDTDLDAQQRDYAEGVHHAGQALLDVINDILDFSKLEAGKLVLDSDDFDLCRLVEEVGDLLAPAAYAKGLELLVDFDPAAVRAVRGDHVRVRQVLLNLASNAVKFTAAGEVRIRVTSTPPEDGHVGLHLEVVDTGIGIAAADQPRVFESFSQADASTTRRYGGTGLGLAISRRLVEAMDGEIGVRSAPGAGSTFWFDVRLPTAALPPALAGHLPAGLLPARLRALVVDDNATNRNILAGQLGACGIAVDVVESAAAALVALRRVRSEHGRYDFAVLDMLMPDVDGLELAGLISADPATAGLPMIMLSSAPRVPQPALAAVGVARWLNKPVRAAALYDSVVRLVSVQGRRGEEVASGGRQPGAPVAAPVTDRGVVLVVEDNELNQLVARGMVERLGFRTDVARNGVEALAALGCQTYDVVLMDCHMPLMDGFAATERIREAEHGRTRIPVVALTASALVSDRERCLAAGMDDFVSKPIDPDLLAEVLDRWAPPEVTETTEIMEATEIAQVVGLRTPRPGPVASPVGGRVRVDAEQVEGLAELRTPDGGSLLASFVASFSRRADDRMAAIRDCVRRGDDDALVPAAHELKGSAATIGAVVVADLCAALEHGGCRVVDARPALLDELADELGLAVDELGVIVGRAA